MEFGKFIKIFKEINDLPNLSKDTIIEQIKVRLGAESSYEYQKWEDSKFNINYKLTIYINQHPMKDALLNFAVLHGHIKTVNALIKNKADVNTQDNYYGHTPLHNAADNGHIDIVCVLIKNNVNVDAQDSDRCTALHLAAFNGHTNIVRVLIKNNANVNARDNNKRTPLLYAVRSNHTTVAKILIKNRADVYVEGDNGDNGLFLLQCVCLNKNKTIAKALLEAQKNIKALYLAAKMVTRKRCKVY